MMEGPPPPSSPTQRSLLASALAHLSGDPGAAWPTVPLAAESQVVSQLVEDCVIELALDVHRHLCRGTLCLVCPSGNMHLSRRDTAPYDLLGNDARAGVATFACPNCGSKVSASRFAPHLEKCMGMGRTSSRLASRRSSTVVLPQVDNSGASPHDDDSESEAEQLHRGRSKGGSSGARRSTKREPGTGADRGHKAFAAKDSHRSDADSPRRAYDHGAPIGGNDRPKPTGIATSTFTSMATTPTHVGGPRSTTTTPPPPSSSAHASPLTPSAEAVLAIKVKAPRGRRSGKASGKGRVAEALSTLMAQPQSVLRDILTAKCGVISVNTGKMCAKSLRCYQHTHEQRADIRQTLLGDPTVPDPPPKGSKRRKKEAGAKQTSKRKKAKSPQDASGGASTVSSGFSPAWLPTDAYPYQPPASMNVGNMAYAQSAQPQHQLHQLHMHHQQPHHLQQQYHQEQFQHSVSVQATPPQPALHHMHGSAVRTGYDSMTSGVYGTYDPSAAYAHAHAQSFGGSTTLPRDGDGDDIVVDVTNV